jgi:plastocyanin domain-containing protein
MKRFTAASLAFALLVGGCSGFAGKKSEEIPVTVTKEGFQPSMIHVKKGTDVTLVVTRKTDETCATDLVVQDRGIQKDLPLNQPVRIALGAVATDSVDFSCGMGMVRGTVETR